MDLRDYVEGSLARRTTSIVDVPVTCGEIPARVAAAERRGNRAVLFPRVADAPGRVVGNLFGSPARICQALSCRNYGQLFRRLDHAIVHPSPLRRAGLPTSGHVLVRDPDLGSELPAIRYCTGDAAPYLTSGIVVTRFPGSARHHMCFVRMQLAGGNRLMINPGTPRIRQIVEETVGRGQELEVAIVIGAPVEFILGACVTMPEEQDKLEVVQALAGESLWFSSDGLPVPTTAEYVLRARIVPQFGREGPFGDVGGVYSVKDHNPLCVVDELWHRPDPLYHSISTGVSREHLELLSLGPRSFLERMKREVVGIRGYALPAFGADRLGVIVVDDGFDVASVTARLWDVPIVRGFVFVNEDVGAARGDDLWWALLHRAGNSDRFHFTGQRHPVYQTERFFIDATVRNLAAWENRRVEVFGGNAS
jgi:4-hydroxy-3-polyprenylbenzoate decarboxylase